MEAAWFAMTRGKALMGFIEDGRRLVGKFSSWAEPQAFLWNSHRAPEDVNVFELPGTLGVEHQTSSSSAALF